MKIFEQLRNKYRIDTEAIKIINTLELVAQKFNGHLPTSFYISDYDQELVKQILLELDYPNPIVKRKPVGRGIYSLMVRP